MQLLNSAISSMPIFFMCSLKIPPGILKQLQRIQRQCFWRKNKQESAPSLAAWDLICRPKKKGGLGILNLAVHNDALLLKHANKFYNNLIRKIYLRFNLFGIHTMMVGYLMQLWPVAPFGGRIF